MAFTVSVRDVDALEERMQAGKDIDLPTECERNAYVLFEILRNAPRVLPEASSLTDKELNMLARGVAYMMRTDIIIPGAFAFGAMPLGAGVIRTSSSNVDDAAHLRNDPSVLSPDWKIPKENTYTNRGAEFFRCYATCISCCPKLKAKLSKEGSFAAAFPLADMTAFLIDPQDLVDYKYSIEESVRFQTALEKELKEI